MHTNIVNQKRMTGTMATDRRYIFHRLF